MDWYLDGTDRRHVALLRHEVGDYLRRHAEPGSDVASAALVVEETVGNAIRHATGPVWVALTWREAAPVLTVRDLGPGFDPRRLASVALAPVPEPDADDLNELAEGGRGLFLVTQLADDVGARLRTGGGMEVTARLPVSKAPVTSHDPAPRATTALPGLDEALPGGGFGREAFLRALVVQLAETLELQHGPDAAEAAVAQVGIDVGARMEEEFRLARAISGRLTPQQLAECLVRLKRAIHGDFRVAEVAADRVVLVTTSCPFGDAVRAAPSLCRMTSSVFGGIAARNTDDVAAVILEERIAVGDPGCRVVVHLGPPPAAEAAQAHHYSAAQPLGRALQVPDDVAAG